jgi:hypothetical protein
METNADDTLVVVWSANDPDVAMNMVFMYCKNALLEDWWKTVRLVVWGPSAKLLSEDTALQAELAELASAGVELLACKACADRYGVSDRLTALGVDVIYMGAPLTHYLKRGVKVLTF